MDITTATLEQYLELGAQIRSGRVDRNVLQRFIEAPDSYRDDIGRWGRIWPVTIDGNIDSDKLIERGNYGWKDGSATGKNFPYVRKGKTNVNLELAEFDDTVTGPEAEKWLDENGYKLEDSDAGLTFGAKYPVEQRRRPVIVAGKDSRWQDPHGDLYVLCLGNDDSHRGLDVYRFERKFSPYYQFLVSRK